MSHRYVVLCAVVGLLVASSLGCGSSSDPQQRILGKWELSKDHLKQAMVDEMNKKAGGEDNAAAKFSTAMMEKMLDNMAMSFDFQQGGKLTFDASMMGRDQSQEGSWEFVSATADTMTLKMGMGDKVPQPATIKFLDDQTIEIAPPETPGSPPPAFSRIVMTRTK